MTFPKWLTIVFAVLFSALFIVSAFPLANGAYIVPTATSTSSASTSPVTPAQYANETATLLNGFTLPGKPTNAELESAIHGGALASALQGPTSLMRLEQTLSPSYAKTIAAVPASDWQLLENAANARLAGASPTVITAMLTPLSTPIDAADAIGISGAVLAAIVIIGCTTVVGCVAGLAIAGLIIAVGYIVALLFGSGGGNCGRCDAALQAETFVGGLLDVLENNANATRTILNDLNTTYVALSWETANAALAQLPNATFNFQLDALQSGVLPQLESTIEGVIGNMANAVSAALQTSAETFGPNGYYGLQGFACPLQVTWTAAPLQWVADPNLYQGYATDSPDCYSETGSPAAGNEQWGGGSNPTLTPGVFPGIRMTAGSTAGAHTATSQFFVQHDARLDAVFVAFGATVTTGPYVGVQFSPVPGTGITWYNYTSANGAFNFTGPNGTYYVNGLAGCATTTFSTCRSAEGSLDSVYGAYLIGVGTMPLNAGTTTASSLATSFNLTGAQSGDMKNVVAISCGGGATGATVFQALETGNAPIQVCDPSTNYTLTEMTTLLQAALNVGDAYWAFLRGQGYTNENQVPTRCIVPNPADIISPNVLGGAAYLASLNATNLLALYLGYLGRLSSTFNETQNLTNASFGGFCGHVIKCQTVLYNVCNGIVGLGNAPVIALGSIYVPPAECEADLGQHCNGEVISNPKTWPIVNTQMLWQPSTGTYSLVLNQTMELPYANPADLIYTGNNSTGNAYGYANLTCQTGAYNALGCTPTTPASVYQIPQFQFHVAGNSTVVTTSIFPADLNLSVGAGWATRVTACAVLNVSAFNGNWAQNQNYTRESGVCNFNETLIHSWVTNDTCLIPAGCGLCPPDCPPPPPGPGVQCPGTADLWVFGNIVNGVATIFGNLPIVGTDLGCFVGYVVLVLLFVVLIYLAVVVFRAVRGRGG